MYGLVHSTQMLMPWECCKNVVGVIVAIEMGVGTVAMALSRSVIVVLGIGANVL